MLKKIVAGYLTVIRTAFRFIVLMALCLGAGFVIVFPLWKLADTSPGLYTLVFAVLAGALGSWMIGRQMVRSFRRDPRHFLLSLFRKLTLAAGFVAAVFLVLAWKRTLAAAVVLATLALYGFLAFGIPDDRIRR